MRKLLILFITWALSCAGAPQGDDDDHQFEYRPRREHRNSARMKHTRLCIDEVLRGGPLPVTEECFDRLEWFPPGPRSLLARVPDWARKVDELLSFAGSSQDFQRLRNRAVEAELPLKQLAYELTNRRLLLGTALERMKENFHFHRVRQQVPVNKDHQILGGITHRVSMMMGVDGGLTDTDMPWFAEIQRTNMARMIDQARELDRNGFKHWTEEMRVTLVNDYINASGLISSMGELATALRANDARYINARVEELVEVGVVSRDVPDDLRHREIDLVADNGNGFTFYEIKNFSSNRVFGRASLAGESVTIFEKLASHVRLPVKFAVVSFSGFDPEVREELTARGIETIGP